jgi:hypothetical protein
MKKRTRNAKGPDYRLRSIRLYDAATASVCEMHRVCCDIARLRAENIPLPLQYILLGIEARVNQVRTDLANNRTMAVDHTATED